MTIRIADREEEFLLRRLAARRGKGVTEALKFVLRRALNADRRDFLQRSYGPGCKVARVEHRKMRKRILDTVTLPG